MSRPSRRRPARNPTTLPSAFKARLLLRSLEERIVPSTFTVTNTNDSGPGSLRAAITSANADAPSADTIAFSSSTSGGATDFYDGAQHTISLLTSLPTISAPITVSGPGSSLLAISHGTGTFRVFNVQAPNGVVNFSGVTVIAGNGGTGSGFQIANATLNLTDVTVTGAATTSAGACIYVGVAGKLNLVNSEVVNNSTSSGGGGIFVPSQGGGIVTITNSTVSNNTAIASGGGVVVGAGDTLSVVGSTMAGNLTGNSLQSFGGAIDAFGTGTKVTISNSTISNNSAYALGGGIYSSNSILTIENSTLSGNTGMISSGAIYAAGSAALTITNSTLAYNSSGASGGGVDAVNFSGVATITSSTITGNFAGSPNVFGGFGGGGVAIENGSSGRLVLDNSIVSGNASSYAPQDIYVDATGTIVSNYDAIGSATGFNYVAGANDLPIGSVLNLGPLGSWGGPTPTIKLLSGSAAIDAGDPAAIGTTDQRGVSRPQGLGVDIGAYERIPGPTDVLQAVNVNGPGGTSYTFTVTYSDDTPIDLSTLGSGNVTVSGALFAGGAVNPAVTYLGANTAVPNAVVATYQIAPSDGSWSTADDGIYTVSMQPEQVSDGTTYIPGGILGSFQVVVPLSLTVTNTNDSGPGSLRDAIARTSAVVGTIPNTIAFSDTSANGSVNFCDGASHTISLLSALPALPDSLAMTGPGSAALTIQRDSAASSDFRLFYFSGTANQVETLSGMTLSGGISDNGGAIQCLAGTLNLTEMTLTNNGAVSATLYTALGGGVDMPQGGALNITDCTLVNNSAHYGGAIVDAPGGIIQIANSTLSNNTASQSGGAIWGGDTITIANSMLTNNRASIGGVINTGGGKGSVTIRNSTLAHNSAAYGGALYLSSIALLTVDSSSLTANSATMYAGGIYLSGSIRANIVNSTVSNNTVGGAGGSGGGMLLQDFNGDLSIISSTISANTANTTTASVGYGGGGIAFFSGSGTIVVDNSIVSGNFAVNGSSDIAGSDNGAVATTYSAIGSTNGFSYTPGPGDLPVGANLNLQPLADNGGPTQTIAFSLAVRS